MSPLYKRIYGVVKEIPKGRVATYGQVARLAGLPRHAQQVGYALNALTRDHGVPWHRVINSKGEISKRAEKFFEQEQRALLEREGIIFNAHAQIFLPRFQWAGKTAARETIMVKGKGPRTGGTGVKGPRK
jgi:methylated-DNA-protein-cysteine methyltransferase-like protein